MKISRHLDQEEIHRGEAACSANQSACFHPIENVYRR
jgi:hypothetical protein